MLFDIVTTFTQLFTASYATITNLFNVYGYFAVFGLMLMEGASLPVPSEVVLPLAGLFVQKGLMNIYLVFFAAILGSTGGLIIDYCIGYFLGKEVVYKHLTLFHIKKESLNKFDDWFARNGSIAVFASRLIPLVGPLMSFPAGFARMSPKKFFPFAIAGAAVWDAVLLAFGYFFLSARSAITVLFAVAVFAIVLYLIYLLFVRKVGKKRSTAA